MRMLWPIVLVVGCFLCLTFLAYIGVTEPELLKELEDKAFGVCLCACALFAGAAPRIDGLVCLGCEVIFLLLQALVWVL